MRAGGGDFLCWRAAGGLCLGLMLLNPGLGTGTKGLRGIAKLLPTPRFSFPKLSKKR